jgi:Zn-dependent protease
MTAFAQGRISLNPARHIDLVGTILVPIAILVASKLAGTSGFLFGWAKPVPVNYSALRRPREHMLWVAAAGPASNLVMALGWALVLKIALLVPDSSVSVPLREMSGAGIFVNLIFLFLNLLPILPLDGGRIVASLLPRRLAWQYSKLEPFGIMLLLVLLFTKVLDGVLGPLVRASDGLLRGLVT